MGGIKFTISLSPVTKKNHSQIIPNPKKKDKFILIPSKQYTEYLNDAGWYIPIKNKELDCPLHIKYFFYMPTKRRVDLTNLEEAIDDILVHYHAISDDNASIIVSHDGSRVLYDKENPRTEVYIYPYKDGCELCTSVETPCAKCEKIAECNEKCDAARIYKSAKTKQGFCPNCGRDLR